MDRSDMADPEQSSAVQGLNARYEQVLVELDELNQRIEAVLNSVRPSSPPATLDRKNAAA